MDWRSPAAKRYFVNFKIKILPLVATTSAAFQTMKHKSAGGGRLRVQVVTERSVLSCRTAACVGFDSRCNLWFNYEDWRNVSINRL